MAKIKVVQVAISPDGSTEYFIDDKGRVWYDGGYAEFDEDLKHVWVPGWRQVDLPEDPDDADMPF